MHGNSVTSVNKINNQPNNIAQKNLINHIPDNSLSNLLY